MKYKIRIRLNKGKSVFWGKNLAILTKGKKKKCKSEVIGILKGL